MIIPQRYSAAIRCPLFAVLLLVGTVISIAAPANDNFASAQQLLFGGTQEIRTDNQGATKEEGEPLHAEVTGGLSVWYKLSVATNGYVTFSTSGSLAAHGWPMDTILAVYAGDTMQKLRRVAGNDDNPEEETITSKVIFQVQKDVTYYVAVDCYSLDEMGTINVSYAFLDKYPSWRAPYWEAIAPSGSTIRSEDFNSKVILINFWATWCPPCIEEVPTLIALHEKYKDSDFAVVGISMDNVPDANPPLQLVEYFRKDYGAYYPMGLEAPLFATSKAFGQIDGIPTSFIIDRENNIVHKIVGAGTMEQFEGMIKPLLTNSISFAIEKHGAKFRLSWKTMARSVTPQTSQSLAGNSWTDLPAEGIIVDGERSFLELSEDFGAQFFRLKVD